MQSRPEIKISSFEDHKPGQIYCLATDWKLTCQHFPTATNENSGILSPEKSKSHRCQLWTTGGVVDVFPCYTRDNSLNFSGLRKALGSILHESQTKYLKTIQIQVVEINKQRLEQLLTLIAETVGLFYYNYKDWSQPNQKLEKREFSMEVLNISLPKGFTLQEMQKTIDVGLFRSEVCNFARYLSECPGNELNPEGLAQAGSLRLQDHGIKSNILDAATLEAQGFGGILAVGKGSINKPCLAILDYFPSGAKSTIVLIGKGVTFDTGGYSIKGKQHHNDMKFDMCGAANVIATMEILAQDKCPARIVGLLPCAENAIGPQAMRPGDVYKAWNGKTVEVFNTDAEGRLLLADALAFAKTFSPDLIVDIATLTSGTTAIAGSFAGVAFTNFDALFPSFKKSALESSENFVQLEILPEVLDGLKSQVADLTNINNTWSTGAVTMHAAAFLQEFVPPQVPWLHLDIANVAFLGKDNGYMSNKGASAYGVRTLCHWIKNMKWDDLALGELDD